MVMNEPSGASFVGGRKQRQDILPGGGGARAGEVVEMMVTGVLRARVGAFQEAL
jgi:hypothetical protein